MARARSNRSGTTTNLGFEAERWAADALHNNMDAAECTILVRTARDA